MAHRVEATSGGAGGRRVQLRVDDPRLLDERPGQDAAVGLDDRRIALAEPVVLGPGVHLVALRHAWWDVAAVLAGRAADAMYAPFLGDVAERWHPDVPGCPGRPHPTRS